MKIKVSVPLAGTLVIESEFAKVLLSLQDLVKNPAEVDLNPVVVIEAEEPKPGLTGLVTIPGLNLTV